MDEETWRIFDVYQRLLEMKIRRKGERVVHTGSVAAAILVYFLKRHGREIVAAYTEAKNRRQRVKFNRIFSVEGVDITLDAPTPLYPVSNEAYHWDKRFRRNPADPVLRKQRNKSRRIDVREPSFRRGGGTATGSGGQP